MENASQNDPGRIFKFFCFGLHVLGIVIAKQKNCFVYQAKSWSPQTCTSSNCKLYIVRL